MDVPEFWWLNGQVAGIGDGYEVRNAANVSGSWDTEAAGVGSWIALTADRTWYRECAYLDGTGINVVRSTFEIRSSTTTGEAGEKPIEDSGDLQASAKMAG